MRNLLGIPVTILIPGMLSVYALAFISGGIYYLEQRVARIRDQFPCYGPLATLTGCAALSIGILMAVAIAGHAASGSSNFRLGALVAVVAGVGFWVYHIHIDMTPTSRIRDATLALICAMLSLLAGWWIRTV